MVPTKNIGRKFNPDGTVRFFPGNTVISRLPAGSPLHQAVCRYAGQLRGLPAAKKYAFLPEDSYHMTVIQGVCEEDRTPPLWTSKLPLDAPLEQVDDFFAAQFSRLAPLARVQMQCQCLDTQNDLLILRLAPATPQASRHLATYRSQVAESFGLHFPDHDSYRFHVSIAYKLWALDDGEAEAIARAAQNITQSITAEAQLYDIPQPDLTYFDTMFHFSPVRIPRNQPCEA